MNLFEMFEQGPPKPTLIDALRDFLPIAVQHLNLDHIPKIKLVKSLEDTTFGRYVDNEQVIYVVVDNRNPVDILRTLAHEMVHYAQGQEDQLDSTSGETGSPIENEANAEAGVIMRLFNQKHPSYMQADPIALPEAWSAKYKKSINCSNPKGFSQKAHCAGRKKTDENFADGKKPGRKGLAKRSGVDCSKSVTALRSIAKNSSGEKQRMAHWCANMKSGKTNEVK
jgi:hypothetical protein